MQYLGLAVLPGCFGLLRLFITLRLGCGLEGRPGWLKGCALLVPLALCGGLALLAWEFSRFQPIVDGARIATLDFRQLADKQHEVHLAPAMSSPLPLHGDLWELDVQVLRWRGLPHMLGLEDGYRLNGLSGRYLSLEQQREMNAALTQPLHATPAWRDAWRWLDRLNMNWLYADAFAIRFMPIADNARFAVEIGATGLSPVAMNPQALEAMKGFE